MIISTYGRTKKVLHLSKKLTNVTGREYLVECEISFSLGWKKLHVGDYLKSNLLQNEKFASLNVHLHTSFEQNVLQIGRYHARSKFIFYAMEFQFIFTWNVKICIKYLLKVASSFYFHLCSYMYINIKNRRSKVQVTDIKVVI